MYPDISYLLHDLFGTQPDNWTSIFKTFGLLLASALLAAGWVLKKELIRLEKEGKISAIKQKVKSSTTQVSDVLTNGLIAFFFGFKIPYIISNFDDFQSDPSSVIFSSKGNWLIGLLLGATVAVYLYIESRKNPDGPNVKEVMLSPHEKTSDIVILAGLSGVIGAKLFSVFENLPALAKDPMGVIFSGSGLNVLGGVILASIVAIWYIRKLQINPWYVMDIGGMGILVGYAVGRLGCQLSGDGDWGIVAAGIPDFWFLPDWMWSYDFPNNVAQSGGLVEGCSQEAYNTAYEPGISEEDRCFTACGIRYCHQLKEAVYTTSVFETIFWFGGFLMLWMVRKKIQIAGILFFLYMIYNGIMRFLIEEIRVNDKSSFLGIEMSQAQKISTLFVVGGITGILWLINRDKKNRVNQEIVQ